jgi:hypothetical protein
MAPPSIFDLQPEVGNCDCLLLIFINVNYTKMNSTL